LSANPYSYGFLADIEVNETRQNSPSIKVLNFLFEPSNLKHLAVKRENAFF
jgi:hypothetical protein